jgi:acyl carrier protein
VAGMNANIGLTERNQNTNALLSEAEVAAVREILAEQLDVERAQITPEAVIDADLGADSLDKVEIVMKLEERFNVTITDEIAETVKSVEDLCEALAKALGR